MNISYGALVAGYGRIYLTDIVADRSDAVYRHPHIFRGNSQDVLLPCDLNGAFNALFIPFLPGLLSFKALQMFDRYPVFCRLVRGPVLSVDPY